MSLRRGVEQQLATRRAVEQKQLALKGMVNEQNILQGRVASDHNAENKRRLRVGRQEKAEIEREVSMRSAHSNAVQAQADAEEEAALSAAVSRQKSERLRDEKLRQRLIEGSEELRALEEKLKAAYTNKERHVQTQEKAILKERVNDRERTIAQQMEADRIRAIADEEERERQHREDNIRSRRIQEIQMMESEYLKQQAKDEYLKEKDAVDSVVSRIVEEDQAEAIARMHKKVDLQNAM